MAKKEKKGKEKAADNQPEKQGKQDKAAKKAAKKAKAAKPEKTVVKKTVKIRLPEDGAATAFTVLLVLVGLVDLILAFYIVVRALFPGLVNRWFRLTVVPTTGWVETVPLPDGEGELPVTFDPPASELDL